MNILLKTLRGISSKNWITFLVLLAITGYVTFDLIYRYMHRENPFHAFHWIVAAEYILFILWQTSRDTMNLPDASNFIVSIMHWILCGTFISMICFQVLREVPEPSMLLRYSPWIVIAIFIPIIIFGPIAEWRDMAYPWRGMYKEER